MALLAANQSFLRTLWGLKWVFVVPGERRKPPVTLQAWRFNSLKCSDVLFCSCCYAFCIRGELSLDIISLSA